MNLWKKNCTHKYDIVDIGNKYVTWIRAEAHKPQRGNRVILIVQWNTIVTVVNQNNGVPWETNVGLSRIVSSLYYKCSSGTRKRNITRERESRAEKLFSLSPSLLELRWQETIHFLSILLSSLTSLLCSRFCWVYIQLVVRICIHNCNRVYTGI